MHIYEHRVTDKFEILHLLISFCAIMTRFPAIVFALVNYLLFETTGQPSCSTVGTAGFTGCECNFLGACGIHGRKIPGLNISNHSPKSLELYAHVSNSKFGRNLAFLCEGNTVAILYDCNNRIPLYAATTVSGNQLSAAPGRRPKGTDGKFRNSGTGLKTRFQQEENDYLFALQRQIRYASKRRKDIVDNKWYKAKFPRTKSSLSSKYKVTMHRGHMIASQYGIGNYAKKVQTFVYTNAVPQFGVFNSVPWKTCESKLIRWGQVYCLCEGAAYTARNVQMFIVVGAIPSTFYGPPNTRFFGSGGFSSYQDDSKFRVNVPTMMWTASCCTYEYTKKGRTYTVTKSTAFWGENVPGKFECNKVDVGKLEEMLTPRGKTLINLFPSSNECKSKDNYEVLP
ncbi:uncharacterized protein LOC144662729 [Oculina patagonica]